MPTKIVLDKTARADRHSSNYSSSSFFAPGLSAAYTRRNHTRDEEQTAVRVESDDLSTPTRGNRTRPPSTRKRSIVSFRSSLLRELSVRGDNENDDDAESFAEEEQEEEVKVRLSSDDIRASPRLMGYLFAMTAGAVMLVSVVQ